MRQVPEAAGLNNDQFLSCRHVWPVGKEEPRVGAVFSQTHSIRTLQNELGMRVQTCFGYCLFALSSSFKVSSFVPLTKYLCVNIAYNIKRNYDWSGEVTGNDKSCIRLKPSTPSYSIKITIYSYRGMFLRAIFGLKGRPVCHPRTLVKSARG